ERISYVSLLTPALLGEAAAEAGSLHRTTTVLGTTAEFFPMRKLGLRGGSFLPPGEMDRPAPLCVIGTTIQKELFGTVNPLGKIIRLGSWRFRVIGILEPKGETI